jgi:hypothetical protein
MALLRSGTRVYGNAQIDTVLTVAGTVAATSTTSGALQITGGAGIGGNLYVGNNIVTSKDVTANNATFTGNLIINGNIVYSNVDTMNIKDPLIEQGGNPNGSALTNNDNKDRGQLLHYYTTKPVDAFMGWDNSASEFVMGSNVSVSNNVVTVNEYGNIHANYFIGNGSQLTGISTSSLTGNFHACVVSNVSNIVAGSALEIISDYTNTDYPAGVFTINQLGPVTITMTDAWESGGTSKDAYTNYLNGIINTQNVSVTFGIANATFDIKTTDTITIGSATITGANIVALGITGNGGTYTIPSSYFNSAAQTATSETVSVNLSTSRGVYSATGNTLTTNQPIPFNITAFSGSFPSSSVPYWNVNQAFTWTATKTTGATVVSGNLTYANVSSSVSGSLTSSGATSGSSPSLDSTLSYSISSSDYIGSGAYGAGTRTMSSTVTGVVNAATKYYPLFWKTTTNSSIPTFSTSDSHNSNNYATGQGANTSTTASNYTWLATPNTTTHTFKHVFLGSDIVDVPDVTGTTTIAGQTYSVWGFTNFSQVTTIVTTS